MIRATFRSDLSRNLATLRARMPQAITRSLNVGIQVAKTTMAASVADDTGLAEPTVAAALSVQPAVDGQEIARVTASLKRIPLYDFGATGPEPSRGTGGGVSVRLKGSQGRYPHAFLATMRSGHRGVYQRTGTKRLPIRELKGPSIGHVFMKHVDEGLAAGQAALAKQLEAEISAVLRSVPAA